MQGVAGCGGADLSASNCRVEGGVSETNLTSTCIKAKILCLSQTLSLVPCSGYAQ
ncbi:hypothetical protein M378DRAFT_162543 [Amanita muscaria Koide BX008]|uniref:Uncharacterized protein n=1 Tax=Amanita muscaria (strain Koide BX008) TaxID=946122 RepID=A0A0C2X883_AMAMK|nr:hypothetical protein M378DRAFT_162543 [Amanita muscaria Koide BX008]